MDRLLLGFSLREPIPERHLEGLKKYRYASVDNSLLSKYVLVHYWNWLVQFVPLWMAPNMVTLIGLLTIFLSTGLSLWYAPGLEGTLPPALYYLISASVWIYASLDAIDGKHARRTGQSGPLGQLFDHGCDALNMSMMNMILPLVFGFRMDWAWLGVAMCFLLGFFVITWDELHTRCLYLTWISGPVEGTILFTACAFLAGFYGQSVWKDTGVFPHVAPFVIGSGAVTMATSVYRVARKSPKAILQLLPFTSFLLSIALCMYLQPALWSAMPWVLAYLGFSFSHATASVILAHLTLSKVQLYEPSYYFAVAGLLASLAQRAGFVQFGSADAIKWLRIATLFTGSTYFLRATLTIRQISQYLDIYCLSIKQKKRE